MSSLCCAVAVCRVAMPMHPKQNLAAANRYGAPLFLRKSNQRFSLPFLCSAIRVGAVPCHCYASLRFSFALPVCASQCRCEAVGRNALPLHGSSPHSLCFADLLNASAWPSRAPPCLCASSQITAMPLQCKSLLRYAEPSHGRALLFLRFAKRRSASPCPASANPGRQCHAIALRLSPHRRCK